MDYLKLLWLSTIFITTTGNGANEIGNICPTLSQQISLNITNVLGTWYVTRGIEHTAVSSTPTSQKLGSTRSDCRTLHLSRNDQSEITLSWNENNTIKLRVNNSNPNMWHSLSNSSLNGTSIKTIQVTQIDDKHIIITSCSSSMKISSAVLSREAKFNSHQVTIASNKLKEQGLETTNTFDRCQII